MTRAACTTLPRLIDELERRALGRDVPPDVAEVARRATIGRFGAGGPIADAGTRRRIEAYFSAVVRRRVTRRGVAPRAASRLVVATVVEDLRAAGRDGAAIWEELQRGWVDCVASDVLEEYRARLCG